MSNYLALVIAFAWTVSAAAQSSRMREIFSDKTKIERPFDLRDPFKAPFIKGQDKEGRASRTLMRDGVYTNVEPTGDIDITKLQVVGVMIGKERRAMARVEGRKDIITLREGMRLGKDNAELKAIHPGGIILVEKLVNVYGEEEYLETVIPITP